MVLPWPGSVSTLTRPEETGLCCHAKFVLPVGTDFPSLDWSSRCEVAKGCQRPCLVGNSVSRKWEIKLHRILWGEKGPGCNSFQTFKMKLLIWQKGRATTLWTKTDVERLYVAVQYFCWWLSQISAGAESQKWEVEGGGWRAWGRSGWTAHQYCVLRYHWLSCISLPGAP